MREKTRELLKTEHYTNLFSMDKDNIVEMLKFDEKDAEELFRKAREVRSKYMEKFVVRGVVEASNYCRAKCLYCSMNAGNEKLPRYRMSADEIVKSAWKGYNHDIKMILLQTGEDPLFLDYMIPAIKRIKSEMPDAEIICCNGERTEKEYQALKDAGADKYILKFETSNPELYKKYRPHSTLEKRLNCAHLIKKVGLGLGTGFIIGLPGQTDEDIANDILMIKNLQPTPMASACPFIPNKGTELENEKAGDLFYSFKVVGISRLINPSVCMPACSPYEYLKKGGQIDGTGIGCTSVTIRLTPDKYRDLYQLYTNDRITINLDMAKEVVEAAHANWENF